LCKWGFFIAFHHTPVILNFDVDFSQVINRFSRSSDNEAGEHCSPAIIVPIEIAHGRGGPELDCSCTSDRERLNASLRMRNRHMT